MQTAQPMTAQEISRLESWLASPAMRGRAMTIDKLQGFFAAIISAPDRISPAHWIGEVTGVRPAYESREQAEEFLGLVMSFYREVADALQAETLELALKPGTQTDRHLDYRSWCDGYILGWSLSTEEWMLPGNEPLKKLTFPILLLSGAFQEDAEKRGEEFMPLEEYQALEQECAEALADAVTGIHRFWLQRRASTPVRREGQKAGRNDPCACGSGKKFKHCCGTGSPTLH